MPDAAGGRARTVVLQRLLHPAARVAELAPLPRDLHLCARRARSVHRCWRGGGKAGGPAHPRSAVHRPRGGLRCPLIITVEQRGGPPGGLDLVRVQLEAEGFDGADLELEGVRLSLVHPIIP